MRINERNTHKLLEVQDVKQQIKCMPVPMQALLPYAFISNGEAYIIQHRGKARIAARHDVTCGTSLLWPR